MMKSRQRRWVFSLEKRRLRRKLSLEHCQWRGGWSKYTEERMDRSSKGRISISFRASVVIVLQSLRKGKEWSPEDMGPAVALRVSHLEQERKGMLPPMKNQPWKAGREDVL